jgi:flagellar export protein FliJ
MKRFISRFEKVRHLRAQQEDTCRAAAAARNAERAVVEMRRDAALRQLDAAEAEAGKGMSSGLTGAFLNSMASRIDQAKQLLRQENELLKKAEERLQAALAEHKQARAELKIVEEVIQRERTEHRHEQLKAEDDQLQEQAAQTFYRNMELTREAEA